MSRWLTLLGILAAVSGCGSDDNDRKTVDNDLRDASVGDAASAEAAKEEGSVVEHDKEPAPVDADQRDASVDGAMSVEAATGDRSVDAEAARSCSQNDGRCTACEWQAGETSHCKLSSVGTCPPGSMLRTEKACPAGATALCDGSSPGYLAGVDGYAEAEFFYGSTNAEDKAECEAGSFALRPGAGGDWIVY